MAFTAQMNRWEACVMCGQPVTLGMPCNHCQTGTPTLPDLVPTHIPMPVSRKHAEMMLLVAQRYLADNPAQDAQTERTI